MLALCYLKSEEADSQSRVLFISSAVSMAVSYIKSKLVVLLVLFIILYSVYYANLETKYFQDQVNNI